MPLRSVAALAQAPEPLTAIHHNAAIVFPPGEKPYILVVLTGAILDEAKANRVIAEVSRAVWENRCRSCVQPPGWVIAEVSRAVWENRGLTP